MPIGIQLLVALVLAAGPVSPERLGKDPKALAQVTCDGTGGFTYDRNPDASALSVHSALAFCVDLHEREHIAFLASRFPNLCEGKPRGFDVKLGREPLRATECLAYYVMRQCLLVHDRVQEARYYWDMATKRYGCDLCRARGAMDEQLQARRSRSGGPERGPTARPFTGNEICCAYEPSDPMSCAL